MGSALTTGQVAYDLVLGVGVAIIDIALTVFLVDRLLMRREERRWEPVRGLVLSELFRIADDVLFAVAPAVMRQQGREVVIGNERVFAKVGGLTGSTTDQLGWLRDEAGVRGPELTALLSEAQSRITTCMSYSNGLVDPTLFHTVLRTQGSLSHARLAGQLLDYRPTDPELCDDWATAAQGLLTGAAAIATVIAPSLA